MRIAIAGDHGANELKQGLIKHYASKGINLIDVGPDCEERCDYPDVAKNLADYILNGQADWGIGMCGTGIGISIALNRFKDIRAALVYSDFAAKMAKKHNNANVLCFGGRTMNIEDVINRIEIFINEEFEGGRHLIRIEKLDEE